MVSEKRGQREGGVSVSMKVGTNVFGLVGEIEVRGSTCKEAGEMLRECLDIVKAGLSKAITEVIINITTWVRSAIKRRFKAFFTRRA